MHDSRTVANRFLKLAEADGATLTPMQLLKLVYIAHGWMLGLYGRPLVKDAIEAWQYGPVIPRLYNAIRQYKAGAVRDRIPIKDEPLTSHEANIIEQVYNIYGRKSGVALSQLTHADGTPWAQSYVRGEFSTPIAQDVIQDHYQKLAAR